LKGKFHQRAVVVLVIVNSAVNQHEFLSGKDVVSFVNCPILNVKLQIMSQEFKPARQVIAVLQEIMSTLKK
jgi:hypothetical protein